MSPPAVPYFDYRPGYRRLRAEIDEAIDRVLASGQLILGPEVGAFEHEYAAAVGVATLMKTKGFGRGSLGSLLEKPVGKWWGKNLDRIQGKE